MTQLGVPPQIEDPTLEVSTLWVTYRCENCGDLAPTPMVASTGEIVCDSVCAEGSVNAQTSLKHLDLVHRLRTLLQG